MKAFCTVVLMLVGMWVTIVLYSGRNEPDFSAACVGMVVFLTPWLMAGWAGVLSIRWLQRVFGSGR